MTGFDDRQKAYENKFAHDAEFRFRVEARTAKLFGRWAAEQLGLGADDIEPYAASVVGANLEEAGFTDVKRKVRKDFDAKGISVSDHIIDSMLEKFLDEAKTQLA
jgi:hypothetical protein